MSLKKYIILPILIFSILILLIHTYLLDGIHGFLFSLAFEDTTIYASGYTDKKYKQIKKGINKDNVLKILGDPLYTNEEFRSSSDPLRWWYSKSKNSSHYRMREVRFANSKVIELKHYYYVD